MYLNKKLLLALPLTISLISAASASNPYEGGSGIGGRGAPSVSMVFDPSIVDKKVTSANVEDHLDNLAVALMEGREDLLAEMDRKSNAMSKKEIAAAKNYAATMSKYEKVALKAALSERQNKFALKQVLEILEGKL